VYVWFKEVDAVAWFEEAVQNVAVRRWGGAVEFGRRQEFGRLCEILNRSRV
jgi:hypothetical protein